jgi:predicted RNA-binding Zn ribbon-like protein
MHWVDVDGYPMPKRVGGHPALDLCNTWAGWGEPWDPKREWIPDYETAAVWTGFAGLVDRDEVGRLRRRARKETKRSERLVRDLHALRRALYLILTEDDDRAFEVVSRTAQRGVVASRLVERGDGLAGRDLPGSVGLEVPLLSAARAAEDLLTSEERRLVGRCPGDDCGWLFLDRRGRRKWCDMASCGNRAKVRAHLARSRRT